MNYKKAQEIILKNFKAIHKVKSVNLMVKSIHTLTQKSVKVLSNHYENDFFDIFIEFNY